MKSPCQLSILSLSIALALSVISVKADKIISNNNNNDSDNQQASFSSFFSSSSSSSSSSSLPTFEYGSQVDSFSAFSTPKIETSFLIEFDRPPAAISRYQKSKIRLEGGFSASSKKKAVIHQHEQFIEKLTKDLNLEFSIRHEFFDLLNGISIDLHGMAATTATAASGSQEKIVKIVDKIKSIPGVTKVSPLIQLDQPKAILHETVDTNSEIAQSMLPKLSNAHEQTGVIKVRKNMNLFGQGIKVGIIDTGVDFTHPAFGSCYGASGGANCRLQFGHDFVDQDKNQLNPGGFDCVGHGSHVAGIIAANDPSTQFMGVAPEAILGSYRVFPCQGSSKDDIIIAALERAYNDGMQVINLSLGGGSAWADTTLSSIAGRLVDLGVVVVAAIGNDGEDGLAEVSSPSVNSNSISVASFEGVGFLSLYFELEGVDDARYAFMDHAAPYTPETPILATIASESDPEGCRTPTDDYTGKVVVIKRGICTFTQKAANAQAAGAVGVIFYNNGEGAFRPQFQGPGIHIFGIGITKENGENLVAKLGASKEVKLVFRKDQGVFENPMANQISVFSSWGLGPELELKPDIGAPGGYIYSTVPVALGSYATMSGTSMATPFVTGAAALLLQSQPRTMSKDVLSIFQNYGHQGVFNNSQVPDTVVHQGAGMINIYDAITGQASAFPSHLALNDTDHTQQSYTLTITNQYPTDETFTLLHVPAMSINGYNSAGIPSAAVTYAPSFATARFNTPSVQLKSTESATVTVQFQPPQELSSEDHWIYSGYIEFQPLSTDRPTLHVPYVGMLGSFQTLDILDQPDGFPVVLSPDASGRLVPIASSGNVASPTTTTMTGRDIVTILMKISNPTRAVRVFVQDSEGNIVGEAPADGDMLGRTDPVRTRYFVVDWAGKVVDANGKIVVVPNGEYTLVIMALKPFSEFKDGIPTALEHWVSPPLIIQRPIK